MLAMLWSCQAMGSLQTVSGLDDLKSALGDNKEKSLAI